MKTYTIGEMSKKLNKSQNTLRDWDKKGILIARRTPTNRRYYTHDQYLQISNKDRYIKNGSLLDSVRGKNVLITGGTGSLGYVLVNKIADYVKKIVVYSRCELKQHNMSQHFHDKHNVRYLIGDVRDEGRLAMALNGIDICIHAACMKRIEKCSYDPFEAVKTNVIGSMNVVKSCLLNNVEKSLMVSTDKSCSCATLYGGTKFVSEQMFIYGNNYSHIKSDSIFTCVRYGNIYGSNGSIKHLFAQQVKDNGKISITHKDMTRFFMGLDDAVNLILFALSRCIGGEIFIPKMKSIKIIDFVKTFYPNVPIEIIGLRGHEKIHEELISETESRYVVGCGDYYKIIPPSVSVPGIGWDGHYPTEKTISAFQYRSNNVDTLNEKELIDFDKTFEEKYSK